MLFIAPCCESTNLWRTRSSWSILRVLESPFQLFEYTLKKLIFLLFSIVWYGGKIENLSTCFRGVVENLGFHFPIKRTRKRKLYFPLAYPGFLFEKVVLLSKQTWAPLDIIFGAFLFHATKWSQNLFFLFHRNLAFSFSIKTLSSSFLLQPNMP